jgi:hypothetical protein
MRNDRAGKINDLGLGAHDEDHFWAHPSDLHGVGFLSLAEARAGRLQVVIRCQGLDYYLDTRNLACFGDLHNLKGIPLGTRVVFSGNVRTTNDRGIRMGRLNILPVALRIEEAVMTPTCRADGAIYLGEGSIPDPNPSAQSFSFVKVSDTICLVPHINSREKMNGH